MTKRVLGVLAALSMLGVVACSSSDPATPAAKPDTGTTDAGGDTPTPVETGTDTGTPDTAVPTDNTTGKQCTNDDDCDTTGNQLGHCSNALYVVGPLNPTPVCVGIDFNSVDACEPSDDTTIRFCDGPDNVGLCQKTGTNPATCDPMCQYKADGSEILKCAGKNACNAALFANGDDGKIVLIGTCQGGCVEDADCPTGSKCDPVQKFCTKTCTSDTQCRSGWSSAPANWGCDTARGACTFKTTKATGERCTTSDECPCLKRTADADGVCTQICKTGSGETLPTGFVCDPLLPAKDTAGAPLWSFTTLPAGLSGYAMKKCTMPSDCAVAGLTTEWSCEESPGVEGGKTCQPKPM